SVVVVGVLVCLPPLSLSLFFFLLPRPPRSPLFPYTTLFRSRSRLILAQWADLALVSQRYGWNYHELRLQLENWRQVNPSHPASRSEEHTSELQSRENLVCRLLLEKKKQTTHTAQRSQAR